jgi:DNA polymerase
MTLLLDARRRAMLAEMGLRVWGPDSVPAGTAAADTSAKGKAAVAAPGPTARAPAQPAPAVPPRAPVVATFMPAAGAVGDARALSWQALRDEVSGCAACTLFEGRRNVVLAAAVAAADWLVVGEAPGESEDLVGTPFAGQDGLLLDNMLRALRLARGQQVYLTHALKCRAPGNRSPEPEEVARCEAHLRREVELLRPKVILALGRLAVQALLPGSEPLGKLRGRVHDYRGVPVVVSYAPAYLLRNLPEKARAWADLCLAQDVAARSTRPA